MIFKKFEDIDLEIEQLEFKKDALLRSKGWESTSSTPGCFWLWKKEVPGFGMILVSKDQAISMQKAIENT